MSDAHKPKSRRGSRAASPAPAPSAAAPSPVDATTRIMLLQPPMEMPKPKGINAEQLIKFCEAYRFYATTLPSAYKAQHPSAAFSLAYQFTLKARKTWPEVNLAPSAWIDELAQHMTPTRDVELELSLFTSKRTFAVRGTTREQVADSFAQHAATLAEAAEKWGEASKSLPLSAAFLKCVVLGDNKDTDVPLILPRLAGATANGVDGLLQLVTSFTTLVSGERVEGLDTKLADLVLRAAQPGGAAKKHEPKAHGGAGGGGDGDKSGGGSGDKRAAAEPCEYCANTKHVHSFKDCHVLYDDHKSGKLHPFKSGPLAGQMPRSKGKERPSKAALKPGDKAAEPKGGGKADGGGGGGGGHRVVVRAVREVNGRRRAVQQLE